MSELPFIGPLVSGSYFLEPEELFGMKYALMHEGWPIPLAFFTNFPVVDHPVPGKRYQIIYTGYRPTDTFILHKFFSSLKFYPYHIDPSKAQISSLSSQMNTSKNPETRPFVGMRPGLGSSVLQFDSKFENGNLDRVVMINEQEYDLYIRSDSNSKSKFSWFFFCVSNARRKGKVRFNIVNMTDPPILYQKGMKPVTSLNKLDWDSSLVDSVEYAKSKICQGMKSRHKSAFYMLSFEITFEDQDKWFIARSPPYSYSQLLKFLTGCSGSQYFKHKQLCKSIGGLHVPLVTITNPDTSKVQKKYILIVSRLDPGESASSYIIEGLIKHLLSDREEALALRDLAIFKIVPMSNPEGVVIGNSRCTITGLSFIKKHSEFIDLFSTEPKFIKKLAYKLHSKLKIHLYLEITSSFHVICSYLHAPLHVKEDKNFLLAQFIPEYLARYSPLSKILPSYAAPHFPLRSAIEKDLRIPTFVSENSVFGYSSENLGPEPHDPSLLRTHGFIIGDSLFNHFLISQKDFKEALRLAASSMSPDKLSLESNQGETEDSLTLSSVLQETFKGGEYNLAGSSDEEYMQNKEMLLESFQDFCMTMSKKKLKKTIKLEKDDSNRGSFIERPSLKMVRIRKKGKREKKIEPVKKECNSIDFSKMCVGFNNTQSEGLEQKWIVSFKKEKKKAIKSTNLPLCKSLSHSVVVKREELPKIKKFGPFPDLQEVKKIKIKMALNL